MTEAFLRTMARLTAVVCLSSLRLGHHQLGLMVRC